MADCSKSGDEYELMLELDLSIGGIFGKPKKVNQHQDGRNVAIKGNNNIQASLRRRELRRKREEKMKKPVDHYGSCGSISGPFFKNKDWLETQIVRQNDDERERKKEKVGDGDNSYIILPTGCRSFRPCHGNMNSNGCASSPYSDGHCSSHQGGATDDSRSNSSNSQLDQHLATTSTASVDPINQPTSSSKQTLSTTKLTTDSTNSESNPTIKPNNQSNSIPPPKPETDSSQHQQASLLAKMPCVSTTGNGPNGKTVSGFLYRYTKNEVSIVCVCHGQSFSPAGFVEHAGGVDIAYPLRHITIFPAAFAS